MPCESKVCKIIPLLVSIALLLSAGCKKADQPKDAPPSQTSIQSEVDFPGMQLRPAKDKSTFTLIGRIRNRSKQRTLNSVTLRMTMEDVLASGATTTLGTATVVIKYTVPPGESDYFEEPVAFGSLPAPKGRQEWNYSVVEIGTK